MSSSGLPELRVESNDDLHAVIHLLERHGFAFDEKHCQVELVVSAPKSSAGSGSVDFLLQGMEQAIKLAVNKPIGFVLDADENPVSRWESVRNHLRNVEVDCPNSSPKDGFIGKSSLSRATVGVWMMPDNASPGRLEDFLASLIAHADPLIEHAGKSTDTAASLGAKFPVIHRSKALIHTWLAWQEIPGKPFGIAMKARYFQHDKPAALEFVDWFRRLFSTHLSA